MSVVKGISYFNESCAINCKTWYELTSTYSNGTLQAMVFPWRHAWYVLRSKNDIAPKEYGQCQCVLIKQLRFLLTMIVTMKQLPLFVFTCVRRMSSHINLFAVIDVNCAYIVHKYKIQRIYLIRSGQEHLSYWRTCHIAQTRLAELAWWC